MTTPTITAQSIPAPAGQPLSFLVTTPQFGIAADGVTQVALKPLQQIMRQDAVQGQLSQANNQVAQLNAILAAMAAATPST